MDRASLLCRCWRHDMTAGFLKALKRARDWKREQEIAASDQ